ncbi:MAG TPA: DUF177 domain-containing protein [Thermoanaerobaculia bacterium]|nr:DUF177 domain-containing protein [Thermoanaerobaculia bacterium]
MRVRLDKVRDQPFRWDQTETVDPARLEHSDVLALSPVSWRGEIRFTDPGFLLTASYSYEQTLPCQRCLEPLVEPVSGSFQLLLLPAAEGAGGGERELKEEELGVVPVHGEEVEVQPLLLEQLQLNVPMKPLCRIECRGLCPTCGADRNRGPCGCVERDVDPRWEALAALKRAPEEDH